MNKRALGNRNKLKAKKYFEGLGYYVENCEVNKICFFGGRLMVVHKDLVGADLLAIKRKPPEIIFIQSKTNKVDMLAGEKEFAKYPFPDFVKRYVVRFEPRKKEPIIKVC